MTGRQWYKILSPVFIVFAYFFRLLPRCVSSFLYDWTTWVPGRLGIALRIPLARRLCKKCGKNVSLHRSVMVFNWQGLDIGDNVSIHPFCYVDGLGGVSIGNDVSIAHACSLIAFEHTWSDAGISIKYNAVVSRPIRIESDVWLGCGVRVLSGAVIRERTIIAAGSVLTRGHHGPGLYAGIPAKRRKGLG